MSEGAAGGALCGPYRRYALGPSVQTQHALRQQDEISDLLAKLQKKARPASPAASRCAAEVHAQRCALRLLSKHLRKVQMM